VLAHIEAKQAQGKKSVDTIWMMMSQGVIE